MSRFKVGDKVTVELEIAGVDDAEGVYRCWSKDGYTALIPKEVIDGGNELVEPQMKKAILEFDAPETCDKCPLMVYENVAGVFFCAYTREEKINKTCMCFACCPLIIIKAAE